MEEEGQEVGGAEWQTETPFSELQGTGPSKWLGSSYKRLNSFWLVNVAAALRLWKCNSGKTTYSRGCLQPFIWEGLEAITVRLSRPVADQSWSVKTTTASKLLITMQKVMLVHQGITEQQAWLKKKKRRILRVAKLWPALLCLWLARAHGFHWSGWLGATFICVTSETPWRSHLSRKWMLLLCCWLRENCCCCDTQPKTNEPLGCYNTSSISCEFVESTLFYVSTDVQTISDCSSNLK